MTYQRQLGYLDLVIKNGSVPHAFLFYGRDGAYQKELAKSFLARLNGPEEAQRISAEVHPDTMFVRRAPDKKEITIAQIRELKSFVSRTPVHLTKKGVLIEEAQYLNEEAWNALLKTLEEPTPSTLIFILSSSLKNIPLTITSRVVSLPFLSLDLARPSAKDDIIIDKLAGLENLLVADKFDLAEDLAKKENLAEIMDHWLLVLRTEMLEGRSDPQELKMVAATRNILQSTNANTRLALESLFLKL